MYAEQMLCKLLHIHSPASVALALNAAVFRALGGLGFEHTSVFPEEEEEEERSKFQIRPQVH